MAAKITYLPKLIPYQTKGRVMVHIILTKTSIFIIFLFIRLPTLNSFDQLPNPVP